MKNQRKIHVFQLVKILLLQCVSVCLSLLCITAEKTAPVVC